MTKQATAGQDIAIQSWLRPALTHVAANKDYALFREQIETVEVLLRRAHLESMALDFALEGFANASAREPISSTPFMTP